MKEKTIFCDICHRILDCADREFHLDTYGPKTERVCLSCYILYDGSDVQVYDLE